jgi:hypothetical protein
MTSIATKSATQHQAHSFIQLVRENAILGNCTFQQRVNQQVLWYIGRGALDQAESLQGTMFRVMMPPLYGGQVVVGGVSVSFPPGQPLPYIHPQSTFWQEKRARMAPVAADGAELRPARTGGAARPSWRAESGGSHSSGARSALSSDQKSSSSSQAGSGHRTATGTGASAQTSTAESAKVDRRIMARNRRGNA